MSDKVVYRKTLRTGGGVNAADGIDGNTLINGSVIEVWEANRVLFYLVDTTGGAAEIDPFVLVPDANPGSINLVLKGIATRNDTIFKEVTIASGVLTLTGSGNYHVDTESDDASDTIESVAGLAEGERAILVPESDARTVIVQNNTVVKLQDIDFTMQSQYDAIEVQGLGGGVVRECWRSSCGS